MNLDINLVCYTRYLSHSDLDIDPLSKIEKSETNLLSQFFYVPRDFSDVSLRFLILMDG